jgi:hypothetical protein
MPNCVALVERTVLFQPSSITFLQNVRKVHPLHEPRYVIAYVGNLTKEKYLVSSLNFSQAYGYRAEHSDRMV